MRRRRTTQALASAALVAALALPSGALAQDPWATDPATATSSAPPTASTVVPGATSSAPAGVQPGQQPTSSAPATSAAPATTAVPASANGGPPADDSDNKTAILLIAIIGAVLLAAALAWAAAHWWAYEAPWWARWRHATAEAGWRTSAAWAEFKDWLRLGR